MTIRIPKCLEIVSFPHESDAEEIEIIHGSKIEEPFSLSSDLKLFQRRINNSISLSLCSLTISECKVKFEGINFKCFIQTYKSEIHAENCSFTPYSTSTKSPIEINSNSTGNFRNCQFNQPTKAGIIVRDQSNITITNCKFSNSKRSVSILDESRAYIEACTFQSASRYSIYSKNNSTIKLEKTSFLQQEGKAIFIFFDTKAEITDCRFTQCKGGCISIKDSSKITVNNCTFNNIDKTSIHATQNSTINAYRCIFTNCKGKGIYFDDSTGYVNDCFFKEFDSPAISCRGQNSSPKIYKTKLKKCKSNAIVSRDFASPSCSFLKISDIQSDVFFISDSSHAVVENCILRKIKKSPFYVFNCAEPKIRHNNIIYDNNNQNLLFRAFKNGKVIFRNNLIVSENENIAVNLQNFGKIPLNEFKSNHFYRSNSNVRNNRISKVRLISIDGQLNININQKLLNLQASVLLNDSDDDDESIYYGN